MYKNIKTFHFKKNDVAGNFQSVGKMGSCDLQRDVINCRPVFVFF